MKIEPAASLDDFLKLADETTAEVLTGGGPLIPALRDFHSFFTADLWGKQRGFRPIPMLLALNAHFYWLAAVRVALSGQMSAVFPLLRTGLEAHCYVLLMSKDQSLEDVWFHRDRSDDDRKACRRAFTPAVSEVSRLLEAEEEGSGQWILEHYEESIGWGGHPNPKMVFQHLHMEDREQDVFVQAVALHGAGSPATNAAIFACLDLGFAMGVVAAKSVPQDEALYVRLNELNAVKDALGDQFTGSGEKARP